MNRWLTFPAAIVLGAFAGIALAGMATEASLNFRVLLDGKPIGQHRFELRGEGEAREVTSQADFKVGFLFLDVYRYRHTATERWRGDCLESLEARTDDNGDIKTVSVTPGDAGLTVRSTRSRAVYPGCVRSFAYWNPKILEGGRLLNAQTGDYLPVQVRPQGEDPIPVNGRIEPARRYKLSGKDIDIDLWYTRERQWAALESRIKNGRVLRYERN